MVGGQVKRRLQGLPARFPNGIDIGPAKHMGLCEARSLVQLADQHAEEFTKHLDRQQHGLLGKRFKDFDGTQAAPLVTCALGIGQDVGVDRDHEHQR
ncbi:hypothetical protein MASR1M6_26870 [Rubrivivax sp.]